MTHYSQWRQNAITKQIDAIHVSSRLNAKAKEIVWKDTLVAIQKAVIEDKSLMQFFGVSDMAQVGNISGIVTMRRGDIATALQQTKEPDRNAKKIALWLQSWSEKSAYKRPHWFISKPWFQETYNQALQQFSLDSVIYNRAYEMMIADLIKDVFIDDYQDTGYHFFTKKTSLFDDVMSKTDVILSVYDPASRSHQNIAIDVHTSTSEHAMDTKKSARNTTICPEFSYSIKKFQPMDRYVCHINPEASYHLLKYYYDRILWASVESISTARVFGKWELYKKYTDILEENPTWRTGIDNWRVISIIDKTSMEQIIDNQTKKVA